MKHLEQSRLPTFLLLLTLACHQPAPGHLPHLLDQEIQSLSTAHARKVWLEQILHDDQRVRGQDAKKHHDWIRTQLKQDSINLAKVESYLSHYGHPKRAEVGNAADAPWMVIHHAQGYAVRDRYFEMLYEAYLNGDINYTAISFFLDRMHEMKFGERLSITGKYRPEYKIEQLTKGLGLDERRLRVESRVKTLQR